MKTKQCSKCKVIKPILKFHRQSDKKDGLRSNCKDCRKKEKHEYYIRNKDHINEYAKGWHKNNPEKAKQKGKKWRNGNTEYLREYSREWDQKNPDKRRERERRRTARKKSVEENYTVEMEIITKKVFGDCCINCGNTENLHIDHHFPLSRGYALTVDNAVVLCRSCNISKFNHWPQDFYEPGTLKVVEAKLKEAGETYNTKDKLVKNGII